MSKLTTLRYFDYVNHPYEAVRQAIKADPAAVFSAATKNAASRANNVAAGLHVNIAGIDIGTDITIQVKAVEELDKKIGSPPMTRLQLEWAAEKMPGLFPFMEAELSIYPLSATETQLDLSGEYQVPLGLLGKTVNAAIGHRIAEASIHQFVAEVAAYLRSRLAA